MREAMTTTVIIGGVIKQEYILIHENNHCHIIFNRRKTLFDGYILDGYDWLENKISKDRELAKTLGLNFEITEE